MPEISGERPNSWALDDSGLTPGIVVVAYNTEINTHSVLTIRSMPRMEDSAASCGPNWVIDVQAAGSDKVVPQRLVDLGIPHEDGEWNPTRFTVAYRHNYGVFLLLNRRKTPMKPGPRSA